jgi:hypothetical protein
LAVALAYVALTMSVAQAADSVTNAARAPETERANGTTLACRGKYSDFRTKDLRDSPVGTAFVEVGATTIRIVGALAFSGTHLITKRDEQEVYFGQGQMQGSINRLDGHMFIVEFEENGGKSRRTYDASCRLAQPLF